MNYVFDENVDFSDIQKSPKKNTAYKLHSNIKIPSSTVSLNYLHLPSGLTNINNCCYINSAIQCLYSIDEFRNLILKKSFLENTSGKILQNVFKRLEKKETEISAFEILKVVNKMEIKPIFKENKQEDAIEFLVKLVDQVYLSYIPDELNKNLDSKKFFEYEKENEIKELFYVKYKRKCVFNDCNHLKLLDPSDEFCNPYKIEGTITETITKEHESSDLIFCKECNKLKNFKIKKTVKYYPKYLFISLHRSVFKGKSEEKINIEMEIKFFIKDHMLHAIIIHYGSHVSGHYIALCRRGDSFYLFDDTNVTYKNSTELEQYLKNSTDSYSIIYKIKED